MKFWLQDNDIEMYSTHNEGKSVVAEQFVRILKNKIYKYMTSVSKNVYIDKLADIINKYNNTYLSTIKMKPVDIESSTYIGLMKSVLTPLFKSILVLLGFCNRCSYSEKNSLDQACILWT